MAEQHEDGTSQPRRDMRETSVVRVMTSTSVRHHPTAFSNTQLPVLQTLLDPDAMTARLRALPELPAGAGELRVSYAKLLAYKQGNRGLIRYDVEGTPWGQGRGLFGKLYPATDIAARVYRTMRTLWDEVYSVEPELSVPQPIGYLADLSLLLYLPAEGTPLDEVLSGENAERYMRLSGRWLGRLHQHQFPLDRTLHLANEMVNIGAWALLITRKYPETEPAISRITAYLESDARALPFTQSAPIHKDFHYGHILANGQLSVIDFDEMRLGDPNFDLAHFCANLHLLAYRTSSLPFGFSKLQRHFLDAYTAVTGWSTNQRFLFFYVYTCLKIAKQLCTTRGLRPRPEGDEQHRQVSLMIEQALSALPAGQGRRLAGRFATLIAQPDQEPPTDQT